MDKLAPIAVFAFNRPDYLQQTLAALAANFFAAQSHVAVAEDETSGKVLGLYILHPNNLGRCGHIANASYAVAGSSRGLHVGEKLVQDCLLQGKQNGFKILQFNAVVASNTSALA